MDQAPRLSVVVPVRDRRQLLSRCLDALEGQTLPDLEIVVVDDSSTDGSDQLVLERAASGTPVTLVRSGGSGAVAARRAGVDRARGRILAFTDSDCAPRPDWAERGVAAIDSGAEMVNGLTVPEHPPRPLERTVHSADEGLYPTCNIFFRRDTYERFGGLDDSVGSRLGFRLGRRAAGLGFGEDTVLAWRVRRGGAPVAFVPAAVVEHHVFPPDLKESASRALQAAAFPALIREVPELRSTLLRRRYLLGTRQLPFYALVGAVATRRGNLAGAVLGGWAVMRLREHPDHSVRGAATTMALEAVTGAALLVGSAKARTLVL